MATIIPTVAYWFINRDTHEEYTGDMFVLDKPPQTPTNPPLPPVGTKIQLWLRKKRVIGTVSEVLLNVWWTKDYWRYNIYLDVESEAEYEQD